MSNINNLKDNYNQSDDTKTIQNELFLNLSVTEQNLNQINTDLQDFKNDLNSALEESSNEESDDYNEYED